MPLATRLTAYWHTINPIEQLVRLRNWYLLYVLLIFLVGGYVYKIDLRFLALDAGLYISAFLAGSWIQARRSPSRRGTTRRLMLRPLTWFLMAILLTRLAVIAYQAFVVYGLRDYMSGGALAAQIGDYGRYSPAYGLYVIANSALTFGTVAGGALYVRECLAQKHRPSFSLLAAVMIGAPILELQRSSIFFGAVFVAVAYIYTARLYDQNVNRRFAAVIVAAMLAL